MPSHACTSTSEHVILDPQRCQFSFSDGRRCRMQSAQPALCPTHAGACGLYLQPTNKKAATQQYRQKFAASLAPLSGEFRTATEINCALGKVFLSLAQNRIPRRDAVALGYLAQLMLQTLPRVKEEFIAGLGYPAWQEELGYALQDGPQDDETEPTEEAAAVNEPQAQTEEAVPLGTPISALAFCSSPNPPGAVAPAKEPPESKRDRAGAVARVFSESAPAESEGPEAFPARTPSPPKKDRAIAPSAGREAVARQQESDQSPEPDGIGPAFPFVSWRDKVGPGWVYWNDPEVIRKLDNQEAIRRLNWSK